MTPAPRAQIPMDRESTFGLPKILAPVDFSERSPAALRYASRLAQRFRSELTLLHVLDSSIYELDGDEASDPAIRKLGEAWSRRTETLLMKFPPDEVQDIDIRRIVLSGRPAEVITNFARFDRTSLIVIPTRGYEPFRRCLLCSVASEILTGANCPVLTGVHTRGALPNELRAFRKILCGVDFCPESLLTLRWASQFAEEFHAQLTIAHITPSTEGGVGEYFNPDRRRTWVTEARNEEFVTKAREKIAEMQLSAGTGAAVF